MENLIIETSKNKFLYFILISIFFLIFLIPKTSLAQSKELTPKAKARDTNGDGVLQKEEIIFKKIKDNFETIDCDKSNTLDGLEIKNFFSGLSCGQKLTDGIPHAKQYPDGPGPFPAIISLHSSGGFNGSNIIIENFKSQTWIKAGYAWYAPNFFEKHGITTKSRMDTFNKYRKNIEIDLTEIISLMKSDPKIDSKNIFAIGFSNGGFWATFLAGKGLVTAGSSHYGVWKACFGRGMCKHSYPMDYLSSGSNPLLALHGAKDGTQRIKFYKKAWNKIKNTPKIEQHVYKNGGHVWDCFPDIARLKKICDKKFDGASREITDDAFKRTLAFFKKHTK